MNDILNFAYCALFVVGISILSFKIGKSEKLDKQELELYRTNTLADSLMHAERSRLDEIQKSIGGITSVNLSPLRYIELVRAEEELKRIRNAK